MSAEKATTNAENTAKREERYRENAKRDRHTDMQDSRRRI